MNILKNLNFYKPSQKKEIRNLLLALSKMTGKVITGEDKEVKNTALKLYKDIDTLNQKLSSKNYVQITKSLKDVNSLLENISFELSFHKIVCAMTIKTLMLDLERTLVLLSELIVSGKQIKKKTDLNIEIKQIFAQAIKEITLAKTDVSNDKDNFIENLKFSSIYDRIEPCFIATDDINEAILSLVN